MNVTIVGTGYVGLVTGTCLAEVGNQVLCIDTDDRKIDGLKNGVIPIYEPGLEDLVIENHKSGRLDFSNDIKRGVEFADVLFIAVGTPPDEDGSADLRYVLQVAADVGQHMDDYLVIATKSTVPVGTADKVREALQQQLKKRGANVEFDVVSNPEFLKEGAAVDDFLKPDRIVVGVDNDRAFDRMRNLYMPFNRNHERVMRMDIRSAELTKYAANAMLATKISFMNEMSNLAERLGADIEMVRKGIGSDPRIGYHFIYPGCGYGGSCFPKDVQALQRTAKSVGYDAKILDAVEEVNDAQKHVPLQKITAHFGDDLNGLSFAIWGLAFKPNTDDMREAPSRIIIDEIIKRGGQVRAYDPVAMEEASRIYRNQDQVSFVEQAYDALNDVDALVIVTEWKAFRILEVQDAKNRMKQAVIIDGRNIYDPEAIKQAGFAYYGIGRA